LSAIGISHTQPLDHLPEIVLKLNNTRRDTFAQTISLSLFFGQHPKVKCIHRNKQLSMWSVARPKNSIPGVSLFCCLLPPATRACDYFHNAPSALCVCGGCIWRHETWSPPPSFQQRCGPPFMRVIISSILGIAGDARRDTSCINRARFSLKGILFILFTYLSRSKFYCTSGSRRRWHVDLLERGDTKKMKSL